MCGAGAERFDLFIVDVDHFKAVNDAHGHAFGDELLRGVGDRLKAAVRATDMVARLGGDEFAVLALGLRSRKQVDRFGKALVAEVRQVLRIDGVAIEPTVSVRACFDRIGSPTGESLQRADVALYRAKLLGRDRVCRFRQRDLEAADDAARLLANVRQALSRAEFEVFHQPVVDLRTRIKRGWEAPVRWRRPARGLLNPASFMPALLDPKTSVLIDEFVLDRSLRQMRDWLDDGVPVTCAGVNLCEAQLGRPDLVPLIMSLLGRYALAPDRLKVEVLFDQDQGSASANRNN